MIASSPTVRPRVSWKLIGRILLFFAFVFLLIKWQERDYTARGEITQAVVTGKDIRVRHSSTGSGKRREHVVSYRFSTPEGEVFEGQSGVLPETWNQTREGGPVTVEYKGDFPGTNRIAGQVAGAGFWWKAAGVLVMLGIASIVIGRRAAIAAAAPQAGHLAQSAAPDRSAPSSIEAFRARNDQPAAALAIPSLWHLALRSPFMVYAILTAVGAMLCLFSLPWSMSGGAAEWLFAVVGAAMLGAGGYLAHRDWKKLQADWQLFQHGAVGEATVTAVEQSNFSINRVKQWRISYSYTDASGRSHSGRSYYLRPEDASGWQAGDTGRIRFDRRDPGQNVWTGRSA